MIARYNIKVNGRWYAAGETIPEEPEQMTMAEAMEPAKEPEKEPEKAPEKAPEAPAKPKAIRKKKTV